MNKLNTLFICILIIFLVLICGRLFPKGLLESEDKNMSMKVILESGFLSVIKNDFQYGENGTYASFRKDGNEKVLFPFNRYTIEMTINKKNTLVFLYQPILIETKSTIERDIIIKNTLFPSGSTMNWVYGFSFWRFTYLYNFLSDNKLRIALGFSMQIRNASLEFESSDGSKNVIKQGIGPVPLFNSVLEYYISNKVYIGTDLSGFYASSKIANGSDKKFTGAIYDLSVRTGFDFTDYLSSFINLRYLGGGAEGDKEEKYTKNWLRTVIFSIGICIR